MININNNSLKILRIYLKRTVSIVYFFYHIIYKKDSILLRNRSSALIVSINFYSKYHSPNHFLILAFRPGAIATRIRV